MKHLGDITKISGYDAPLVDCVIGGSPCQDLSAAGLRQGFKHGDLGDEETTRSGLFMEQIRIIKELRNVEKRSDGTSDRRSNDDIRRVRYGLWENVYGALSSSVGQDFRIVLESFARVAEEGVSIPMPKNGKWKPAGAIIGNNWSIAWRCMDAQHWGVPQRRRRICLLADFDGLTAPDIVFESAERERVSIDSDREPFDSSIGKESRSEVQLVSEGCTGDSEQSEQKRKGTSLDAERSAGTSDTRSVTSFGFDMGATRDVGAQFYEEKAKALTASVCGHHNGVVIKDDFMNKPVGVDIWNLQETGDVVCSLTQAYSAHGSCPKVITPTYAIDMGGEKSAVDIHEDVSPTLCRTNYGEPALVYDARGNGDGNTCPTMTGDHENRVTDYTGVVVYRKTAHPMNKDQGQGWEECDYSDTLNLNEISEARVPNVVVEGRKEVIAIDKGSYNQGVNAKYGMQFDTNGIAYTQVGRVPGAVAYADATGVDFYNIALTGNKSKTLTCSATDKDHVPCVIEKSYCIGNGQLHDAMNPDEELSKTLNCLSDPMKVVTRNKVRYVVRRLTPLEAERLQGFPDYWTDIGDWVDSKGKKHNGNADSPRYKALGNSIALPQWRWVIERMCQYLPEKPTMASLFDGIGGFPYIWETLNGKGTCLWASEIEEFPIAVTERRINGRE